MGLKEENEFKKHIQLESVSEAREEFVKGNLFKVGQEVIIKETGQIVEISRLGSNYVIIEDSGKMYRKWIHQIESSMYADKPDWGTPESTKKAKKITPGQGMTKRFKSMYDEIDHTAIAKKRIDREKNSDAQRHKRMMNRAKIRDTINSTKGK